MGLSVRKFAALVGVSAAAISKAVRSGRLTTLPDGTIDPVAGAKEWEESANGQRPTGISGSTGSALGQQAAAARALKATLEARLLELELKKKSGEVVPVAVVEARAFKVARRVRETLMSTAARLAPVIAGISDADECFRLIESEMAKACDELSALPERSEDDAD